VFENFGRENTRLPPLVAGLVEMEFEQSALLLALLGAWHGI